MSVLSVIGPAIDSTLHTEVVSIILRTPSSYVDGNIVDGVEYTIQVRAIVNTLSRATNKSSDGEINEEAVEVFFSSAVRSSGSVPIEQAALVSWQGRSYSVDLVESWLSQAGFHRIEATRLGQS